MAGGDLLPVGETAHGNGLEDAPHRPKAVVGGGDDAGVFDHGPDIVRELRLAENHTGHAELHRQPEHLRLTAADQDGLLLPEGGQLPGLGEGQDHLAGEGVDDLLRLA